MFSIEKRGAAVVDSAPNPRVIEASPTPTTQHSKQNFEMFTEADLSRTHRRGTSTRCDLSCLPRMTVNRQTFQIMKDSFALGGVLLFSIALPIFADDWPQWRGPQRDGISKETGLLKEWPKEGPKLNWKASDLGSGYSTPAVVGERLYLLANESMESEFVQAHAVKDGKRAWRTAIGKVGPNIPQMNFAAARSTPTVDGEVLYALGSDGDLASLEISTGKVRWKKNLRTDFSGKPGDWAYTESPLIDGDVLVCTPGGAEATLVAMNKTTGTVKWKCTIPEGDSAAFASAIVVEAAGVKQYVQLLQKGDRKSNRLNS